MLFVCTWLWGTKWGDDYAVQLFAALRRHIKQEFRAVLITDRAGGFGEDIVCPVEEADKPLLEQRGCLVRMRMFDAAWQARIGAKAGDRIVNIDVDAVVTGDLDVLFDRRDEFTIMQGFNQTNPCPFNGSLWMFRAGERHDVFDDFSFKAYADRKVPFHAFPDDQGWLHYKFPNAAAWTTKEGVYAFKKINWPAFVGGIKHGLPLNARVVAFPGRAPKEYQWLGWVRQHWGGNLLITPDYVRENARLHQVDARYGAEGYLWAYLVAGIAKIENCTTILDYGCGKGTLAKAMNGAGIPVAEYDPAIPGKDTSPDPADLVVALDVLEHIEVDCVGDVIDDLARLATKKLFVVISTKPSKRLMADGRDTHLSLHDDDWWMQKFSVHKFKVLRVWNTGLRLWVALMDPPKKNAS